MERTDILQTDVFFSWTGVDRELKNIIVDYLRKHNITCTESDYACSGNFEQWSVEAVSKSSIFLLLYTKDTPKSRYVPDEIRALQQLEDHTNRCVPVVTDFDLFRKNLPELGSCISAVILESNYPNEAELDKILHNIRQLLCNRMYTMYRKATSPAYLRFVSMLRGLRLTEELDHEKLYIDRTVTDEAGKAESDAAVFCKTKDIIYLHGPAGSGKTCYIDQLRNAADDSTLVLALPCRDLAQTQDLFAAMYEEFCEYIGNRDFYTPAAFRSLLSAKHLLLVLDGLDEIGTQAGKDGLLCLVRSYYKANSERTTLFITSRSDDDADMWKMNGQTPQVWALNSLEDDQIRAFSSELFLLLGSPEKGDDFYIRLQDLEAEIRTNPLLISQLAIVYKVKNQLPQTIMGIYDAVCEITIDSERLRESAKADFDPGILRKLSAILKAFSTERYLLASAGKEKTAEQILGKILRDQGFDAEDAPLLLDFLHDRAILVGKDAFYHKMLQEYYTALYYYDRCFDLYGELENEENLSDLFTHCSDPYWSAVLQMFLVKADSCVDEDTTKVLYHQLMAYEITDFTLFFDVCKALARHKTAAQQALLTDLLSRSADGTYPPYGPLCWYVPAYELYAPLLSALEALQDQPCFTKALALTRDVCWIFGRHHTLKTVAPQIDGAALLEKATLRGIRKGLCELFFLGETQRAEGTDVYPRCFNLAEAKHWMAEGQGILGRMDTPFQDELGLYTHEMLHPFGNEWVGIVSMPYDIPRIEDVLPSLSCKKLCGLFLSPSENTRMERLAINDKHICVYYLPENVTEKAYSRLRFSGFPVGVLIDNKGILYFCNKLTVPDSVRSIGDYAFYCCRSLQSITIPDSVTSIGKGAFYRCSSLQSITIPNSVTSIGDHVFRYCSSLTSITIPDSVTSIDSYAFEKCSSLTGIWVDENNTNYSSDEMGVLFNKNKTQLIHAPDGLSGIYTIPDSVTSIGNWAFHDCSSLQSITIPDRVTSIGFSAFFRCSSLTAITIPDNVTSIDDGAFSDCSSLQSITIPDGVTSIGGLAFSGCSSLQSIAIPDSVTSIGGDAFRDCSSLQNITILERVTYIGRSAFWGCSSLTGITIPDSVKSIGRGAFWGCSALAYIKNCPTDYDRSFLGIPDTCIIEYRAALHSPSTPSISDPSTIGITKIEKSDLSSDSSHTSVVIPEGITSIDDWAFSCCSSLQSITIPDSVTSIGYFAFEGCSSLTSITIGDGVTSIGFSAFRDCSSLTAITIPDSVTSIDSYAFENCSSLTGIWVDENNINYSSDEMGVLFNKNKTQLIHAPGGLAGIYTIPDGVTSIGDDAFRNCSRLTSITIPDGVTRIGERAFSGCSSLQSITIPDSVTSIGNYAFQNCSSLTSIVIPKAVRFILAFAFKGCTGLREITISRRFEDKLEQIFPDVDLSEVKINWL